MPETITDVSTTSTVVSIRADAFPRADGTSRFNMVMDAFNALLKRGDYVECAFVGDRCEFRMDTPTKIDTDAGRETWKRMVRQAVIRALAS